MAFFTEFPLKAGWNEEIFCGFHRPLAQARCLL